jgi:hypothetical protein
MTEHTPGTPLGAWLADLTDERLIRLLELRPDLTRPPPSTIAALAARAQARQSVKAATDELDFPRLAVLDALLVLHADTTAVPLTKLLALIGDRAREDTINAAVDDLRERALIWGDATVRVAAEAAAGLPWYPGQAILEGPEPTPAEIADLLAGLDAAQLDLLNRLLEGSPMGRTRDAAPGTPPERPVQRLLAAGLLRQVDAETVILPRQVGQVLRGELPGPLDLTEPDPVVTSTTATDVDATAAGAVIDLLREVELVLETLGATPVPELRSGGLGVRDVKRLTKLTGIDDTRLGLILEVASAAGLISAGLPDPAPPDGAGPYWAPTVAADRFVESPPAARWQLLASTWLDLPSRPGLIGSRGPDGKPYAALSDSLYSTAAPLDRRLLLSVLADLPAGAGVDAGEASRAMIWRRPRWAVRLQPDPVRDLLAEAHAVGLVGRGAIATPARRLLAGDPPDDAVAAMTRALPEPELGVGGDDEPGPPIGGRVAQFRPGPAELLLEEAERVLHVETAQERLPGPVHFISGGGGAGGPQPQRLRVPAAGQAVHLEADEGALDDGQLAVVVLPGGAAGELLVQPGPGRRLRGAVPGCLRDGCRRRLRPGRRLAEAEPGPVPGRPAVRPGRARRDREVHDPIGAQPARDVHGQVPQQPGQPGQVIAGIEHDDDVRVALTPVPGRDEARGHVPDLRRGDLGGVVGRSQPDRVQRQRPRRPAGLQCHDPGVGPAGDHLRVPLPARVAVAEQPLRAGLRIRPQPVAHVAGQPDPPVVPPARRDPGNRPAQPADPDLPAVHRVVDASVAPSALRLQAQLCQHVHPLRPARERVAGLEQHVPARPQRAVQFAPEPGQPRHPAIRPVLVLMPGHNESHGHRLASSSSVEGTRRSSSGGRLMSPRHAGQHKQLMTTQTTWVK